MSSSLARQLKNLAAEAPSASKRPSLLFTQREAASMGLDEVFDLATNGLLELAQLDDRFAGHALLSAQARRMDREGQSAEENKQLDEMIGQFLLLLSPYFMLRPCHKVLEWLLRRFSVHRFNVLDVMAMCLPYHETVMASRLVQVLVLERTVFSFFEGVRKTGAPMPRAVLIERCAQSTTLMPFVFERVQASVALRVPNAALFSLWGSLCVGVLRFRSSEETVRVVLPLALDGLTGSETSVRAASHMALAQICASSVLEQAPLDAIVASFDHSNLLLLCLVFQTQPLARATPALAAQLLEQPDALVQASAKYDIGPVLSAVLRLLVDPSAPDASMTDLLAVWRESGPALAPLLSPEATSTFVAAILLECVRSSVAPSSSYKRTRLSVVLLSLGSNAGLGVAAALEACAGDAELHSRLERLALEIFGAASLHSPLPGAGTTLFLSLSHAEARVRQLGIAAIDREVRAKRIDAKHLLVQNASLLARDADVSVAETVLQAPWLLQALSQERLGDLLRPLLSPNHVVDQRIVRAALSVAFAAGLRDAVGAAAALCVQKPKAQGNPLVPFGAVLSACSGAGANSHPVVLALAGLCNGESRSSKKQKSSDAADEETGLRSLIKALADACRSNFGQVWETLSQHLSPHVLLLVAREMLPNAPSPLVSSKAVQVVEELTKTGLVKAVPSDDDAWKAELAIDVNLVVADTIVALAKHGDLSGMRNNIFELLCKLESSGEAVALAFQHFLGRVGTDASSYLCDRLESGSSLVAVRALHLLEALFQANPSAAHLSKWVACLLVPLQSSNGRVRRPALRCVARLAKAKGNAAAGQLIKAFDEKSGEIKHSADAVSLVMQSHGKEALTWAVQQLREVAPGVQLALLRGIRLVADERRIELLDGRLKSAVESGNVVEAQLLLEGLVGCSVAVASHEQSVALVVAALRSGEEAIAKGALGVVTAALWGALDAASKRTVLAGLCFVSATRGGELAAAAARVTREVGAARGTDIVAAELHLNLGGGSDASASSKRTKQPFNKGRLMEELSRLEVVLELLRASRGGDAVTAAALLKLLGELSHVIVSEEASIGPASDYVVQLTLASLSPLVENGTAKLDDAGVGILLQCLYANHTPHLRKTVLSLLSASADHDALPVARQILQLFRADSSELVAVDNKASFRVMRSLLEKVLPHLSAEHGARVLDVFVKALPKIPQHRRLVLLESAAKFLPGAPVGRILHAVLGGDALEAGQTTLLAGELCRELGALATAGGFVDYVKRAGAAAAADFVAATLSGDAFVTGCVTLATPEERVALEQHLGNIFRLLLSGIDKSEQASDSVLDAIDAVNELFTVPHFVEVVRGLLTHRNHLLRLRATRIIAERVSADRIEGMSKTDEAALVSLMPALVSLIEEVDDAAVLQAALLALDVLGRSLGAANAPPTLSALNAVSRLIRGKPRGELFASGLLTMSALSAKLGPVVLPHLSDALQLFLEGLTSPEVAFVALSGIFEIVTSLGAFLGPFAESLLRASLHASLQEEPHVQQRSRQIADAFAHTLAPRLLGPVLHKLAASEESPQSVKEVVRAAGFASTQTSRPGDLRLLWDACVAAFDSPAAARDPAAVLVAAAEAAAEVAFHLSESEFRPLYAALLASVEQDPQRRAAVFCVASALLARLHALAVPWVCKLSDAVAKTLTSEQVRSFAGRRAVELLHKLFEADTDRAISKEVHAALIDPLVNCLDVDDLREQTIATLVEMAKSQANDALWKPLNYQVLLKMRSRNPAVTLACIRTIHEFWKTFKEDFLLLLPETMPFLGEVLEEDDEHVVKAAQTLLALVNSFLPSSITF